MNLQDKNPTLLCIDLQMGFLDEAYWGGGRNNKDAEKIAASLMEKWRRLKLDIIHARHASTDPNSKLHPNHEGFNFQPMATPMEGEFVVTKSVNSCFIGTKLQKVLDNKGCKTLVIVGLTTDHCVSTTTRMAGNLGYEAYLVSDATATFDRKSVDGAHLSSDLIHKIALASLHGEFATVVSSDQVLASLT